MNFTKKSLLLLLVFSPFYLLSQTLLTQTVKGSVFDKSVKTPLIGASVALVFDDPAAPPRGTTTDADGNFRLPQIPVGKHTVRVSYLGYKTQTLTSITVNSGKEVFLNIEMEEDLRAVQAVEIVAKIEKEKPLNELSTVSARTFSVEETQRFAAAVNDPARMAASFAGVMMGNDGNNTINIRGNSANGLVWRMEGVEIPNPNHFSAVGSSGGGISILSAQLLTNSDFMTGAFAAEYGNALSGVFDLRLRKGNSEKREYTFSAGLLGLDAAAEGPLRLGPSGRTGSFLVNYRYSTLSLIGKLGVDFGGSSTDFQDLSFNFWLPAGRFGTFTVFGLGGLSLQKFKGTADSLTWEDDFFKQYTTRFGAKTAAVGLTHSLILGEKTFLKTVLATSGTENTDAGDQFQADYSQRKYWNEQHGQSKITLSTVLNHKFNARNLLRTGFYASQIGYDLNQANWDDDEERLVQEVQRTGTTQTLNAFAQWQFRPSERWTLNAGLHSFHFFLNQKHSLEPRFGAKYALSERRTLSFGYGLHSQMQPLGTYFIRDEATGAALNEDMDLSKAQHFVLGFDQMLPGNLHLKTEAYYQHLTQIPVTRGAATSFSMLNLVEDFPAEALENTGRGRNMGLELTFEKFLTRGLYFLLSSSVFESEYRGSDGIWRGTRFNLNHAHSLVAGKEWPLGGRKNRTFAVNIKLTQMGGLRETPLDLEASRAKGETVRDEAQAFESRLPAYFRLDTGLRLKRNYRAATTTLSLDILNTTNRKNVFSQYFDEKTLALKYFYQAPLIPVLAYKVEF
ncbi:MAG: TonB-dependent receptor [Saprospiraceae bacterium]